MKIPSYVTDYIEKAKSGQIIFNKERIKLISFLEDNILQRDDLYFDDQRIEDYIKFSEKWFFPLQDFKNLFHASFFYMKKKAKRLISQNSLYQWLVVVVRMATLVL